MGTESIKSDFHVGDVVMVSEKAHMYSIDYKLRGKYGIVMSDTEDETWYDCVAVCFSGNVEKVELRSMNTHFCEFNGREFTKNGSGQWVDPSELLLIEKAQEEVVSDPDIDNALSSLL